MTADGSIRSSKNWGEVVTATVTVITGVIVFVLGQAILKFMYEPYLEQQKVMLEVIHSIYAYSDAHAARPDASDVGEKMQERILEASNKFKSLSAQLMAANAYVKWYGFWRYIVFAPSYDDMLVVSSKLITLSNMLAGHEVVNQEEIRFEILKRLGVPDRLLELLRPSTYRQV